MNRRDFIKLAGAASVGAVTEQPVPPFSRRQMAQPRQAIVILGESVRYDMLNCNAKTGLHTPNLDRIAARGVRFERAYNCQPVCSPARSALWTGLYPHTNGVWGNSMALGETTHTIGQRLTDKGIRCAFMGKWHLSGTDYFDTGRPAAGWDKDSWYDMRDYLYELSPADRVRSRRFPRATILPGRRSIAMATAAPIAPWIFWRSIRTKTFSWSSPTTSRTAPASAPSNTPACTRTIPSPRIRTCVTICATSRRNSACGRSRELSRVPPPIHNPQFFGAHTFIDHEIGRVLDAVENRAPGAMILYTSDHGVFLESHRLRDKGPAMYDEITRVPFLAMWPGHAPANVTFLQPRLAHRSQRHADGVLRL